MTVENTTRYRRSEGVSFTELDGEIICLNLESGQYLGLKDVGRGIWEELGEQRTFEEILRRVIDEYDVDPETATRDIHAFLAQLLEAGLVETT